MILSDATAANMLGLSTQVPARPVYLTSGASRSVQVGNLTIRFKHAAPSRMVGGDTKPGLVLRALRFLGIDGIDDGIVAHLRSILSDEARRDLGALRSDALGWMRPVIDEIIDNNNSNNTNVSAKIDDIDSIVTGSARDTDDDHDDYDSEAAGVG